MPISLLSTACSNWYSCCKEQIKLVKWGEKANASASLCTLQFFGQQLESQAILSLNIISSFIQTETLVAKTVQKIACQVLPLLVSIPFDQNLSSVVLGWRPYWCSIHQSTRQSILSIHQYTHCTKYTPVYTVYKVYSSIQHAVHQHTSKHQSTKYAGRPGLVWSRTHYVNNIGLVSVKRSS